MGYTGVATLPSPSTGARLATSRFVGEVLTQAPKEDWFRDLGRATQEAIDRSRVPPALAGHAYLAVGWNASERGAPLFPSLVVSSNARTAFDPVNHWRPTNAFRSTGRGMRSTAPGSILFDAVGAGVPEALFKKYRGIISYRRRQDAEVIVPTVELMIEMARESAETNPGIGKDYMVTVMPKVATASETFSTSARGISDPVTDRLAGYVPEGGGLNSLRTYTPLLITSDGAMFGEGRSVFGPDAMIEFPEMFAGLTTEDSDSPGPDEPERDQ